jgi:hypothetical protein
VTLVGEIGTPLVYGDETQLAAQLDNPMIVILLGLLAITAVAVYWQKYRAIAAAPPTTAQRRPAGRFGAVEIRIRGNACDAVRALEGQSFLSKDAPSLPLAACTATQCSCRFAKLPDRRRDGRRVTHGGLSASLFESKDRRSKRDRRV